MKKEQKITDTEALALLKFTQGLITEEEYKNILEPDKGWRIRCPTEWGGHGRNFNMFFCSNCKKEFCLFDEKGEHKGSIIELYEGEKIIGTRTLCWFCTEYEEEHREFQEKINKK